MIEVHHSYVTVDLYLCHHLYHFLPNVLYKTSSFILFHVGWYFTSSVEGTSMCSLSTALFFGNGTILSLV